MYSKTSVVIIYHVGHNFKLVTNIGGKNVGDEKNSNNRQMDIDKSIRKNNGSWDRKIENYNLGSQA